MKNEIKDILVILAYCAAGWILAFGFWSLIFTQYWWIPSHGAFGFVCLLVGARLIESRS